MSVIDRIQDARQQFLLQTGVFPNAIYLSEYYYKELYFELHGEYPKPELEISASVFGMDIIITAAQKFMIGEIKKLVPIDNENED